MKYFCGQLQCTIGWKPSLVLALLHGSLKRPGREAASNLTYPVTTNINNDSRTGRTPVQKNDTDENHYCY